MKKMALAGLIVLWSAAAASAVPTDDEVMMAFEGVFGVYGAVFMTSMMGQTVPGTTLDLDMQNGSSNLIMDEVEVEPLFASIDALLEGSGDMPVVAFSRISGSFATTADGTLELEVHLIGGPVKTLEMKVENDELSVLKADGRNYDHLRSVMDYGQ